MPKDLTMCSSLNHPHAGRVDRQLTRRSLPPHLAAATLLAMMATAVTLISTAPAGDTRQVPARTRVIGAHSTSVTGTGEALVVNTGALLSRSGAINGGTTSVAINGTAASGSAENVIGPLTLTTKSAVLGSGSIFPTDLGGANNDLFSTSGRFNLGALTNPLHFDALTRSTGRSYKLTPYAGIALTGVETTTTNLPAASALANEFGEGGW